MRHLEPGHVHQGIAGSQRGFTMLECIAAAAVLAVAMVALLAAMTTGVTEVDAARRSTTALFLAEQRLEEIRACALSTAVGQGFAAVTTVRFPAEAYGSIASHGDYRRWVTIVDTPGGAVDTKQVEVWVAFRFLTSRGHGPETAVTVSTLLVRR